MKVSAIIAAAGIGKRMGSDRPKQYLEIGGRPIICHTLDVFKAATFINELIVVIEPDRVELFRDEILKPYGYPANWKVTVGGDVRQESVANGLELISPNTDVVVIHDGVRPFISLGTIEKVVAAAARDGAALVAAPIKETVKRVGADGLVIETVDRSHLWGAQTPQCFLYGVIREAMASAIRDNFIGTDESSIVERIGVKVSIVEGDSRNIKITTPEDIIIAEATLKAAGS